MQALQIGVWAGGSLLCIALWVIVTWHFRQALQLGLLHQVVVLLTVATLVLYDLIVAAAVLRIAPSEALRYALTFAVGVQIVDALAALLFVRRARRVAA